MNTISELFLYLGSCKFENFDKKTKKGNGFKFKEASVKVGDKLFFIGGFDQNAGFERGNPGLVRRMVHECFESAKNHGSYLIAPSDHFFTGNPENLKAFADACKECLY